MTIPKHVELFIRSDGAVVAQCRTETAGRLDDPVSLATSGTLWDAFKAAWGAAQLAQIDQLQATLATRTTERDQLQLQADRIPGLESQLADLTADRDQLQAEVDRLTALVPPPRGPREITPEEFLTRFSPADIMAIDRSTDPRVILAKVTLQTRSSVINLDSPTLAAMIDGLIEAGVPIDETERARIFA